MSLYQPITNSELLSQGDILFNVPVLIAGVDNIKDFPDFSKENLELNSYFNINWTNLIVMSQACDLANEPERGRKPLNSVVCAAIFPINNFPKNTVMEVNSNKRPAYFILHKEDSNLNKSYIIDFSKIYALPYDFLSAFIIKQSNRIRPTNPYLEQISHHFGNFFSRVGSNFERDKKELGLEYDTLKDAK